ncbi:hypothetical protein GpartN1_g5648.t1 [Galdieria partita]|uniref:BZIP domain-containing protein n=1 Tax=Galdieria partita TaxID=83374 RepID=A0A9C7Q292_9RHOD|nr:hypothetical protein GpartN1_g5648.t1 [Galdieria partita]
MCAAILQKKEKDKYIESSSVASLPVISPCNREHTSLTIEGNSANAESTLQTCTNTQYSDYQYDSNLTTIKCEAEKSQETRELKRERSRRLAREFRARKKEEILHYRAVIVSLTNKVREMTIENRRLQHSIDELKSSSIYSTRSYFDMDNGSSRKEQIIQLQKQVLQLQLLLSNLSSSQRQADYIQVPTHSDGLKTFKENESRSFTLPPLKTEMFQNASPYSIVPEPETSPRQLNTPRLNEVVFSYCTMDTGTASQIVTFPTDGNY